MSIILMKVKTHNDEDDDHPGYENETNRNG